MMTVKELKETLEMFDEEMLVALIDIHDDNEETGGIHEISFLHEEEVVSTDEKEETRKIVLIEFE